MVYSCPFFLAYKLLIIVYTKIDMKFSDQKFKIINANLKSVRDINLKKEQI